MKILISAYACETNRGSEPGIGWHWVTEMARLGHEVTALIYPNDRQSIEVELEKESLPNLKFEYLDTPIWLKWWFSRLGKRIYVHYYGWQILAYFRGKELLKTNYYDAILHVTMGSFRIPSFLCMLNIPFVFGPVGGGETAPWALLKNLPLGYIFQEKARALANRLHMWDPFVRMTLANSDLILCKTSETQDLIPGMYKNRTSVLLEVGAETPIDFPVQTVPLPNQLNLLFVGRLLYWKGIHLVIKAFALLKKRRGATTLTIIGRGPDKIWLEKIARKCGMEDMITWIDWIEQDELFAKYSSFDVMVFPSLHDSGGSVVLEALAHGLPVVCLDLGGPKESVNNRCGKVVMTENKTEEEVVNSLATQILNLVDDDTTRSGYRKGAWEESKIKSWKNVVKQGAKLISEIPEIAKKIAESSS